MRTGQASRWIKGAQRVFACLFHTITAQLTLAHALRIGAHTPLACGRQYHSILHMPCSPCAQCRVHARAHSPFTPPIDGKTGRSKSDGVHGMEGEAGRGRTSEYTSPMPCHLCRNEKAVHTLLFVPKMWRVCKRRLLHWPFCDPVHGRVSGRVMSTQTREEAETGRRTWTRSTDHSQTNI